MSKSFCARTVEFRAEPSDGKTLEGYAAVFGQPTEINSWEGVFEETIIRGAFAKTLSERMPVLQYDHGRDMRTGSVPIGAIKVAREDSTGLFIHAEMFDNAVVEPIRQAIAGGAIDGMSFRFRVIREKWTDNAGKEIPASELSNLLWNPGSRGPLKRQVLEVECPECGPVVFPAYEGTSVGVRSLLAGLESAQRTELMREIIADLRPVPGIAAYLAAMTEVRAGNALSADTMTTLQNVLDLVAGADENVDEAQIVLSDLMGVDNPDAGDDATSGGRAASDAAPAGTSDDGTDAGQAATSGMDAAARSRALQMIDLRRAS